MMDASEISFMNVLTERQKQILRLAAEGNQIKQIAYALDISPRTCKNHIYRIKNVTGAKTITQAAAILAKEELLHSVFKYLAGSRIYDDS